MEKQCRGTTGRTHLLRDLGVHVPDGEGRGDDESSPGGRREGNPSLQGKADVVETPEVLLERYVFARVLLGERMAVVRISDKTKERPNARPKKKNQSEFSVAKLRE